MPLYKHQSHFLDLNPRKAMLAWEMGTGKTRAAINWALQNNYNTLVVCPKGLVIQWQQQLDPHAFFTVMSKEQFKLSYPTKYDALIVDEADHFFSAHFKSQLSKCLRIYIRKNDPALLLLTGTPYRSSPWNIYTAATLLGIKWDYQKFQQTFFYTLQMGHRLILQPKKDKDSADNLKKLIRTIADVVTLEECADIPPQIDETLLLGQSEGQVRASGANPEVVPIARFTYDHKVEAEIGVEGFKIERIKRILEENQKVIVVCRYLEQLDTLQKEFGFQALRIDGSVKNRHEVIRHFEHAASALLLVQSGVCEGYETPSCDTMVFASMDFSYRNYQQMRGRILRLNKLHKNTYIHLVAGKADKAIMTAMLQSRDFDVLKDYN